MAKKRSLLDLPLDVQQSIVQQLDWRTLPKAALACKPLSEIVREHTSSPDCGLEWSHAMFKGSPDDSPLLSGGPKSKPGAEADFVSGLLDKSAYLSKSARPDLVVVTATPSWEPKLQLIADAFLDLLPNKKTVHIVCCVAVGIIGTDENGQVHEIEDGHTEADAIAVALVHLGANQRVFSMCEKNNSARQRKKKFISTDDDAGVDSTLDEMEAFMKAQTGYGPCTCAAAVEEEGSQGSQGSHQHHQQQRDQEVCKCQSERSILGFLVGDNVYDVSDMKTKIEGRIENVHLMGGLCGYDTRKQAVYYSSPEFRKYEEEMILKEKVEAEGRPQTRSAAGGEERPWRRPRISAAALFVCNLRSTRASYRGIKQLMGDYKVDKVEMDEDGSKVYSLRKYVGGGDGGAREGMEAFGPPMPTYQVLKELEEVHGGLHGVTFGVKRVCPVSIDSMDPCLSHQSKRSKKEVRTQVESVDIVRGVWDATSPGTSRLEAIVVPLDLKPEDVCSFYTYSSEESLQELGEILDTLEAPEGRGERERGSPGPAGGRHHPNHNNNNKKGRNPGSCFGGFLVICNARGTYLHNGRQNVESNVLASKLPNTPVIGFFANGEVGPMPYREYNHLAVCTEKKSNSGATTTRVTKTAYLNTVLQGNTSVLTLLRR